LPGRFTTGIITTELMPRSAIVRSSEGDTGNAPALRMNTYSSGRMLPNDHGNQTRGRRGVPAVERGGTPGLHRATSCAAVRSTNR